MGVLSFLSFGRVGEIECSCCHESEEIADTLGEQEGNKRAVNRASDPCSCVSEHGVRGWKARTYKWAFTALKEGRMVRQEPN